jgi:hypothetical protein
VAAVDARGRLYTAAPPFRVVNGVPTAADSVAIERFERGSNKRDTVTFMTVPKGSVSVSGSGGGGGRGANVSMRIGGGTPFSPQDQWIVAPDGRVAIVDAEKYQVTWVDANGRKVATAPIRFDRVKVSEDHKKQWRDQQRNATGLMIRNDNGRQTAQQAPVGNVPEPSEWPEYLPPFLGSALSISPDGLLWVRRTGPANMAPTYDLIDGGGRVVQKVVLPQKHRLAGFGSGTMYVVRTDDDDLQYLQRYRYVAPDRP